MSDRAVAEQRRKKQSQMNRYDRRGQRTSSNIFSAFTQQEIQEFKEAFNMIDQNHDGYIDHDDLIDMMTSLGTANVTDDEVAKMLNDAPGPVNFTMFLTMFSERLQNTDPGKVLLNAFRMFDEQQTGFVSLERLRHLLTSFCNRWTQEMVDELYNSPLLADERGFNYVEFVRRIKGYVALDDEDEEQQRAQQAKQLEDDSQPAYMPRRLSFRLPPEEIPDSLLAAMKTEKSNVITEYAQIRNQPASKIAAPLSIPLTKVSEQGDNKTTGVKSPTVGTVLNVPISMASGSPAQPLTAATPAVKSPINVPITKSSGLTAGDSAFKQPTPSNKSKDTSVGALLVTPSSLPVPIEVRTSPSKNSTNEVSITVSSPVEQRVTATKSREIQQQQPQKAPQKSIAEMRQNFFSPSTDTTLPHLPAPNLFPGTSVKPTSSGPSSAGVDARSAKTNIPVLVAGGSGKKLSQDVTQMNSKVPPLPYVDDTMLPPILIEAKFAESRDAPRTIIEVSPTILAPNEPPPSPSSKVPWRQQSQQQAAKPIPAQRMLSQQISQTAKALEASGPFAAMVPEKKRFGSSDKVQQQKQTTSGNTVQQEQQPQLMLMQENPLSRQMPAYGYHTVTTTTTMVTTSEEQMTSSSTSSKEEQLLDTLPVEMPPGYTGERKLSFAKIVLSTPGSNIGGSSSNLMTTSSGSGTLPVRVGLTDRMPQLARIRSIENNSRPNDAASRIMSSSMFSLSSNAPRGAAQK